MNAIESTTIPFTLQNNLVVVDVRVNGEPAQFLLDTGASASLIGTSVADRLGLEPATRGAAMGAGGSVTVSVVRLRSLALGDLTNAGIACTVMDLTGLIDQVGKNIEGVLGFDFFGSGTLHVDYPARTVRIARPQRGAHEPQAHITGRTATLPAWGLSLSWPDETWIATTEPPLPSMPVVIEGPGGAEVSVTLVEAAGLSLDAARASMELSVPAQVNGFVAGSAGWGKRAGGPAFRMIYSGLGDDGQPIACITEGLARGNGLVVITAARPIAAPPGVADAIDAILASATAVPPPP
jgi:hypothetical protein